MAPLVSVVMPVYNGEPYISEAIRSVVDQRYPDWELVVIDDGSTDHTREIVASFSDSRIRYIYQENRGQAVALNHGLELSLGAFVTTLDADDWYTTQSLYDRANYLIQHPEFSAVYGDGYYCDKSGEPFKRFSDYRKGNIEGDLYEAVIETSFFGTGAPVMISREAIESYQLRYDESIIWCQDWDFYIRLAEHASFGYVDSIVVFYRLHGTNMTMVLPEGRRLDSLIRTKKKVLDSFRFKDVSLTTKSAFFYYLLVNNLNGRPEIQEEMISSAQFCDLPNQEKARLLRLMASEYILEGKNIDRASSWLTTASKMNPWDKKLVLMRWAFQINNNFAKFLIRTWRASQTKEALFSPLEIVKQ
jgi:glycosyltransferase involved in cell wall biosynthesis